MAINNLLLVGDGNHQFIINLAIWLKKEKGIDFQIDILSNAPVKNQYSVYYNNVYTINTQSKFYSNIAKIKGLRRFYRFFLYKRLVKKLPRYEVVNFHFLSVDRCFLVECLKKNTSSKLILSIWGSDMYKITDSNEPRFIKACRYADTISFTNEKSVEFFQEKYSSIDSNLSVCRFGLAPLDNLIKSSMNKSDCKDVLGWDQDKLSVVVGYNLQKNQQHIDILNIINQTDFSSKFKNEIQLIIPITYGGTKEYKEKLLFKLEELPYKYIIYDSFLTDEEVAYLRNASDILIQLQKTDQFSGSMLEHLYTKSVVITGSWLPYETLMKEGAWYLEIDEINELKHVLSDVLNNYEDFSINTARNPEVISEMGSWELNIKNWIDLYSS